MLLLCSASKTSWRRSSHGVVIVFSFSQKRKGPDTIQIPGPNTHTRGVPNPHIYNYALNPETVNL